MSAERPSKNEIFNAAAELVDGAERNAYLNEICANDPLLRQEVEDLLARDREAGSFIESPPPGLRPSPGNSAATMDSQPAGADSAATGEQTPQAFGSQDSLGPRAWTAAHRHDGVACMVIGGRYALQEKIGEGGMGEVWVAKQTEPVKRKVALKLIKTGMDSRAVLQRFEQERQALALMDHPNIAKVLDGGMTPTGQPYFVMELVNGLPLNKFCDELKLPLKQRLELFVPICQAVQHAHQKGIVHRDLKPANILVTMVDGQPVPKVIDFGVAKATSGKLTEETMSTGFGAVVGTLEYMSPEQAGFSGEDIDTRADIYSLGVILYELLTGLRPIDGKRLRKAALTEMIRIIREEEPSKPSTRLSTNESLPSLAAVRQIEPKKLMALLRGDLDCVVMKCLEKQRDRRYGTANALARDLQRYLANEEVEARPPSAGYRLRKFVTRHQGQVIAASLLLVALIGGLIGTSWGYFRAEAERRTADRARINAQNQKKVADEERKNAVNSSRKADANARKFELQLAQSLVSQADAYSLAKRYLEARGLYAEAYDRFVQLGEPLVAAELGLWSSYVQTEYPLLTLSGHTETVTCVASSPHGRTALSGSWDKTLKLWDLSTGQELRTLTGHTKGVTCVAIAPDARTALSASWDKTLKLWDLVSGQELRTLTGHTNVVTGVAIAPDGRTALSCSRDATMRLWDLSNGQELRKFTGHTDVVNFVAIAPDGRTALSSGWYPQFKHWDLSSGKELRSLLPSNYEGRFVAIIKGKDNHAALFGPGSADGGITLMDYSSGQELRVFRGHTAMATCVASSPDGRTALSGSVDKTLKLWDLSTGQELRTLTGHTEGVTCVAITPDGRAALSGGEDKTVKVWNLAAKQENFIRQHGDVWSVAITADGRTALSFSQEMLKLWDLSTGQELRTLTGHTEGVTCAAITPNGRTALSCSYDATMRLWDLSNGQEPRTFTGHAEGVTCVAITPDGRTALSGGYEDKALRLWDLSSGQKLRTFTGHTKGVSCVAVIPDSRTALSGSSDKTLKLWELASGQELRTFTGHTESVTCVASSPDGRTALSGSWDKTLKLWDLSTGQELRTLTGHTGVVSCVAIAMDGRTAFSCSSFDKTLKLWDLATGKELRTFIGDTDQVNCVAITPDGRTALSGGRGKPLKRWDFARGVAQREFERRVTAAQETLRQAPQNAAALATLGEWYTFRGLDLWAVDLLTQARERGAAVSPVTLACCYWNLGRLSDARREFQLALDSSADVIEQSWLGRCIQAIDTEPERKREWEAYETSEEIRRTKLEASRAAAVPAKAILVWRTAVERFPNEEWSNLGLAQAFSSNKDPAAAIEVCRALIRIKPDSFAAHDALGGILMDQGDLDGAVAEFNAAIRINPLDISAQTGLADVDLAAGRWQVAIERLVAFSADHPQDTALSLKVAALQAWFDQDAELAATCRRAQEFAKGVTDPVTADRAAKIACVKPSTDTLALETAVALARHATVVGKDHKWRAFFQLALGMAEYRSGNYATADEAFEAAVMADGNNPHISGMSAFYRAMGLFKQGREAEARQLAIEATAKLRPLPTDEQKPLANHASADDLILWMAYKEAKELLQFDAVPATPGSPGE